MKLTLRRTKTGFRWTLTAANGRKLANGGEAYRRAVDMRNALSIIFNGWVFREPREPMRNRWNQEAEIIDLTRGKKEGRK